MAYPPAVLWLFLCRHIHCPDLPEKKFRSYGHTLGRCICFRDCLYRHVADGKKKGGKLVLVDCNQSGLRTFIFRKALCIYQCVLCRAADYGPVRTSRMDKKSKSKELCFLRKSLLSDRNRQAKAHSVNSWLNTTIAIGLLNM